MANVKKTVWRTIQRVNYSPDYPELYDSKSYFPRLNCVNNKMREFQYWNIYQRKCTKLLLH